MNSPTSLAALRPCWSEHATCRLCGGVLEELCSFGELSLTSRFPRAGEAIPKIPMTFMGCPTCGLKQLRESTYPSEMYRDGYGYKSGVNEAMVRHLVETVDYARAWTMDPYQIDQGGHRIRSVVLDIGCNDGTLLRAWGNRVDVVGYDPIAEPVPGAEVHRDYWHPDGRQYAVITSLSMLYDVEDPLQFAKDIAASLTASGVWIAEVGYAGAVEDGLWDAICHEHLTYWGLKQFVHLADMAGLNIINFHFNHVNGGSVRVTMGKTAPAPDTLVRLQRAINREEDWDWDDFRKRVDMAAKNLRKFCQGLATNGKKIYVLGASTKGNVLLQMAYLHFLHAAIDRNPEKVGKFTPGTAIPIQSEEWAADNLPDYYLVLPYHFREGILKRHQADRERGVKFIFPLPTLEVV